MLRLIVVVLPMSRTEEVTPRSLGRVSIVRWDLRTKNLMKVQSERRLGLCTSVSNSLDPVKYRY